MYPNQNNPNPNPNPYQQPQPVQPPTPVPCPNGCGAYVFINWSQKKQKEYYTMIPIIPGQKIETNQFHSCPNRQIQAPQPNYNQNIPQVQAPQPQIPIPASMIQPHQLPEVPINLIEKAGEMIESVGVDISAIQTEITIQREYLKQLREAVNSLEIKLEQDKNQIIETVVNNLIGIVTKASLEEIESKTSSKKTKKL